jgi:hypothetical protein
MTQTLSTSKNQSSHKSAQGQRARITSQATTKVVKSRKRKMVVASTSQPTTMEDEAISPTSDRIVQSLSRKAMSKRIIDKAVSVSRTVARKRNEQDMNSKDATLNRDNEMQVCVQSYFSSFNFVA